MNTATAMRLEAADAARCGRSARDLAREAFVKGNLAAYRDHEALVAAWRDIPGFMAGYCEGAEVRRCR